MAAAAAVSGRASPEPARPGRGERRSGRQVSQRQLEPAVTGQRAVGPVCSRARVGRDLEAAPKVVFSTTL